MRELAENIIAYADGYKRLYGSAVTVAYFP